MKNWKKKKFRRFRQRPFSWQQSRNWWAATAPDPSKSAAAIRWLSPSLRRRRLRRSPSRTRSPSRSRRRRRQSTNPCAECGMRMASTCASPTSRTTRPSTASSRGWWPSCVQLLPPSPERSTTSTSAADRSSIRRSSSPPPTASLGES